MSKVTETRKIELIERDIKIIKEVSDLVGKEDTMIDIYRLVSKKYKLAVATVKNIYYGVN